MEENIKNEVETSSENVLTTEQEQYIEEKLQEEEEAFEKEEEKNNRYFIILIILFLLLGLVIGIYFGRYTATHTTIFGNPIKCGKPTLKDECNCSNPKTEEEVTTEPTTEVETTEVTETTVPITSSKTTVANTKTTKVVTTTKKTGNNTPSSTVIEVPKGLSIVFENVVLDKNSTDKTTPTIKGGVGVEYNVILNQPNDYYSFTINIVNNGTIDAIIDNYITSVQTETESEVIEHSLTYADGTPIKKGDVLLQGQIKKIKFTARYKDTGTLLMEDVVSNFSSTISFVQK